MYFKNCSNFSKNPKIKPIDTDLHFKGIDEPILMMLNSLEVCNPRTVRSEEDNGREEAQLRVIECKCI
jgi:hypothetical protein